MEVHVGSESPRIESHKTQKCTTKSVSAKESCMSYLLIILKRTESNPRIKKHFEE